MHSIGLNPSSALDPQFTDRKYLLIRQQLERHHLPVDVVVHSTMVADHGTLQCG